MEEERQPFEPEALEPAGFKGCGRPALIGCGSVFLILALVFLFFLFKAGDLVRWSLEMFENQVLESLPPDVSRQERDRLEVAFSRAIEAIETGRANSDALPGFQRTLLATSRKIDSLSREDVLELTAALEALAEGPVSSDSAGRRAPPPARGRTALAHVWPLSRAAAT